MKANWSNLATAILKLKPETMALAKSSSDNLGVASVIFKENEAVKWEGVVVYIISNNYAAVL